METDSEIQRLRVGESLRCKASIVETPLLRCGRRGVSRLRHRDLGNRLRDRDSWQGD